MIRELLGKTPQVVCLTDSRSLFECAGSTKAVNDKRLCVKINALRQMIYNEEIILRWIDGKLQLDDALTKKGASPFSLIEVLKSGDFTSVMDGEKIYILC